MKGENQFFMPERSFPDNVPAREICITGEERRQSSIYLQSLFNAGRAAARAWSGLPVHKEKSRLGQLGITQWHDGSGAQLVAAEIGIVVMRLLQPSRSCRAHPGCAWQRLATAGPGHPAAVTSLRCQPWGFTVLASESLAGSTGTKASLNRISESAGRSAVRATRPGRRRASTAGATAGSRTSVLLPARVSR